MPAHHAVHRGNHFGPRMIAHIETVNPAKKILQGRLKDGGVVNITILEIPPTFVWPKEGEYWYVRKEAYHWKLDHKMDLRTDFTVTDLQPGQAKLSADEIYDNKGKHIVAVDDSKATDNQIIIYNNKKWIVADNPGAVNGGSSGVADGISSYGSLSHTATSSTNQVVDKNSISNGLQISNSGTNLVAKAGNGINVDPGGISINTNIVPTISGGNSIIFSSSASTALTVPTSTANSGTLVTTDGVQSLTNKVINSSNNTLQINGSTVTSSGITSAMMSTPTGSGTSYTTANITVDSAGRIISASNGSSGTLSTLNSGTGISSFSYTGASSASVSIDNTVVATLTDSQTLTNKTLTSPTISGTSTSITNVGTLALRDTSAAYDVTVAATSSTPLTAARILTIDLANAARTLKLDANITASTLLTTASTSSVLTSFGTSPTFTTPSITTSIDSSSASFTAFATPTTLTIGNTSTSASSTTNIATAAISTGTKTINIGTNSAAGSTTSINIGSQAGASGLNIYSGISTAAISFGVLGSSNLIAINGLLITDINMNGHKVTGVTDPTSAQDAATKNYVDSKNYFYEILTQSPSTSTEKIYTIPRQLARDASALSNTTGTGGIFAAQIYIPPSLGSLGSRSWTVRFCPTTVSGTYSLRFGLWNSSGAYVAQSAEITSGLNTTSTAALPSTAITANLSTGFYYLGVGFAGTGSISLASLDTDDRLLRRYDASDLITANLTAVGGNTFGGTYASGTNGFNSGSVFIYTYSSGFVPWIEMY